MNELAGHVLGDWLLQNRHLARAKRHPLGLFLHSAIYALSVALFTRWSLNRILLVFNSHVLIDGLSLGKTIWPNLLDQGDPDSNAPAPNWLRLMMDQALHIVALALIGGKRE